MLNQEDIRLELSDEQLDAVLDILRTSGLRQLIKVVAECCKQSADLKRQVLDNPPDTALFEKASERLTDLLEELECEFALLKEVE